MKTFFQKTSNQALTAGLILLTGVSNILVAAPRVATNPSGKSLDEVGDNAISWFLDDIRPWIIVLLVIGGILGGWLGGRFRLMIAGTCLGLIVFLMALPSIIAKIYAWM